MKKSIIIIGCLSALFIFHNCKKENSINKKIAGTWEIIEYNRANSYLKNDFSNDRSTLEFFKEKKAYTKSLQGFFKIDYSDITKKDFVDTFKYELKNNDFFISSTNKYIRNNNIVPIEMSFLVRKRFRIEEYKKDKLKLVRIDSTDLYIKATKQ